MRKRLALMLIRMAGWFHRGTLDEPRFYSQIYHSRLGINAYDDSLVLVFDVGHDCIAFEIPKSLPGDMYSYVNDNWDLIADDEGETEYSDE